MKQIKQSRDGKDYFQWQKYLREKLTKSSHRLKAGFFVGIRGSMFFVFFKIDIILHFFCKLFCIIECTKALVTQKIYENNLKFNLEHQELDLIAHKEKLSNNTSISITISCKLKKIYIHYCEIVSFIL